MPREYKDQFETEFHRLFMKYKGIAFKLNGSVKKVKLCPRVSQITKSAKHMELPFVSKIALITYAFLRRSKIKITSSLIFGNLSFIIT